MSWDSLFNAFPFIIFVTIVSITNWFILKRPTNITIKKKPLVSILLPARNEEKTIVNCAKSLLNQDYENYELIVLDDNSTDKTLELLKTLKIKYPELKILKGKPLPNDWLGKHWACHQLSSEAKGQYLLFTDADTKHSPEALTKTISIMENKKLDMLTGFVKEKLLSFGEMLTVPFIGWVIFAIMPLIFGYLTKLRIFSATVGQFMLFRRDAYDDIGGYESVKNDVTDDMALGRKIQKTGKKWRLYDLTDLVSCRMYNNFKEAFNGFSKNLYSVFWYNPLLLFLCWGWFIIVFIIPIITLVINFNYFTLVNVSLITLSWLLASIKLKYPLKIILFYPLIILTMFIVSVRSMILTYSGQASWKGRKLSKKNR